MKVVVVKDVVKVVKKGSVVMVVWDRTVIFTGGVLVAETCFVVVIRPSFRF